MGDGGTARCREESAVLFGAYLGAFLVCLIVLAVLWVALRRT